MRSFKSRKKQKKIFTDKFDGISEQVSDRADHPSRIRQNVNSRVLSDDVLLVDRLFHEGDLKTNYFKFSKTCKICTNQKFHLVVFFKILNSRLSSVGNPIIGLICLGHSQLPLEPGCDFHGDITHKFPIS